jgi:hypothetical protein
MRTENVLTVFVGSPGDLQEERRGLREVVDRLNRYAAKNLGLHVELLGWENTPPGLARPQAKINEDVQQCDLFVGLLWKRWGMDTGKCSSGFLEEFELAANLATAQRRPEIWLFFKGIPDDQRADPGPQLFQVLAFRKRVEDEKKCFYKTFDTSADWKDLIYDLLMDHITRTPRKHEDARAILPRTSPAASEKLLDQTPVTAASKEIHGVLAHVVEAVSGKGIEGLDEWSRSRLYLLSSALMSPMTEPDHVLGVHELHALYRTATQVSMLREETGMLVRTLLLDNFDIYAGWRWLTNLPDIEFLKFLAEYGDSPAIRAAALRYLLLASPVSASAAAARLLEDQSEEVKGTALDVLALVGSQEIEGAVLKLADSSLGGLKQAAWNTRFAILGRFDPDAAVALVSSTPVKERGYFRHMMGDVLHRANGEAVWKLVKDEDESVRASAIGRLCEELDESQLIPFTKSESVHVRSLAYLAIRRLAPDMIDVPMALESLTKQTDSDIGYVLRGIEWSRCQAVSALARSLSKEELERRSGWLEPDAEMFYEALAEEHFDAFKDQLRHDIDTRFSSARDRFLAEYPGEFRKQCEKLIPWVTAKFLDKALGVLSRHGDASDIERAKGILCGEILDSTQEAVACAVKLVQGFGCEPDAPALVDLIHRLAGRAGFEWVRIRAADALLNLRNVGNKPAVKMLLADADIALIALGLRTAVEEGPLLSADDVRNLLYVADSQIRMVVVAFLVVTLPDVQLTEELEKYPTGDGTYYFDVVCWLDRCLFAPTDLRIVYRKEVARFLRDPKRSPSFRQPISSIMGPSVPDWTVDS